MAQLISGMVLSLFSQHQILRKAERFLLCLKKRTFTHQKAKRYRRTICVPSRLFQAGVPNTILGYPFVEANECQTWGFLFPFPFGDFRRAPMIVDRVALAAKRDPFNPNFPGNEIHRQKKSLGDKFPKKAIVKKKKVFSLGRGKLQDLSNNINLSVSITQSG
ncbi:MAG: hypothetical protein CM15mV50_180 [uncultured marine virus]|nr:MAG: hypothetical protein CM15mV50_180 [uncultured marine virus]